MAIVNEQIEYFRQFLIAAWPHLDQLMENHDWDEDMDFIDNWQQVNWEFLVERQLLEFNHFLSTYNFFYGKRVTHPNVKADHWIVCKPKNGLYFINDQTKEMIPKHVTLIFEEFLKKKTYNYGTYPPFDYACLRAFETKAWFYVPVSEIDFHLEKIESSKFDKF